MKIISMTFLILVFLCSCTSEQVRQTLGSLSSRIGPVTQGEASQGLKQALLKGAQLASSDLAKTNGFFGNQAIKILFPQQFHTAEKRLRQVGLSQLTDRVVLSFNRAAESAVTKAYPIFAKAITGMTIQDAMSILLGGQTAATDYLKRKTTASLVQAFFPIVKRSSDKVLVGKFWGDLAGQYNQIPFVKPLPVDINSYVTRKTVDGVFHVVQSKEADIRNNPVSRTTSLLAKVFGYADSKKAK